MKNIIILVFALMSFLTTAQTVTIEKVGNYVRINGIVEGDKYHHIAHLNQNFYNVATGLLTLSSYNNAVLAKKLTLVTIAGATTEAQKLTWLSTNLTLTVSGGGGGGTSDATAANQVIEAVKLDSTIANIKLGNNSQNDRLQVLIGKDSTSMSRKDVTIKNIQQTTSTATTVRATTSGTIALDAKFISVSNVGATDGVFNGVALKSYESVTLPYGVGVKYPALTYNATGTEFYIIAIH
jgi:hypothetical protein